MFMIYAHELPQPVSPTTPVASSPVATTPAPEHLAADPKSGIQVDETVNILKILDEVAKAEAEEEAEPMFDPEQKARFEPIFNEISAAVCRLNFIQRFLAYFGINDKKVDFEKVEAFANQLRTFWSSAQHLTAALNLPQDPQSKGNMLLGMLYKKVPNKRWKDYTPEEKEILKRVADIVSPKNALMSPRRSPESLWTTSYAPMNIHLRHKIPVWFEIFRNRNQTLSEEQTEEQIKALEDLIRTIPPKKMIAM